MQQEQPENPTKPLFFYFFSPHSISEDSEKTNSLKCDASDERLPPFQIVPFNPAEKCSLKKENVIAEVTK